MITVIDQRGTLVVLGVLLALVVGTAACAFALGRTTWLRVPAAALTGGAAAAWFLVNGRIAGATIVEVTPDNGLHVADLLAVPGLLLLAALCLRAFRDR